MAVTFSQIIGLLTFILNAFFFRGVVFLIIFEGCQFRDTKKNNLGC